LTEEFQAQRRFALIDARLDRRLRHLQLESARQTKSRFLVEYLQRLSDLQNLTSLIRRKNYLLGRETLPEVLLDTGTLAADFFERAFDLSWESMITLFKPTVYEQTVAQALAQVDHINFLPWVDFWCARYMLEFLRRTRQISFGVEPVVAYFLAREHELRVVRTIVAGKIFNYPSDRLDARRKDVYLNA
jgi:V/A-type H+/Na+-transporting ATPase subunit C